MERVTAPRLLHKNVDIAAVQHLRRYSAHLLRPINQVKFNMRRLLLFFSSNKLLPSLVFQLLRGRRGTAGQRSRCEGERLFSSFHVSPSLCQTAFFKALHISRPV